MSNSDTGDQLVTQWGAFDVFPQTAESVDFRCDVSSEDDQPITINGIPYELRVTLRWRGQQFACPGWYVDHIWSVRQDVGTLDSKRYELTDGAAHLLRRGGLNRQLVERAQQLASDGLLWAADVGNIAHKLTQLREQREQIDMQIQRVELAQGDAVRMSKGEQPDSCGYVCRRCDRYPNGIERREYDVEHCGRCVEIPTDGGDA